MVKVESLGVAYGKLRVIENLNITFETGKISVLYGPSGCGKTSLLNAIAKNISYKGKIHRSSKLSYVFQEDRLLPWLTVYENLDFVLKRWVDKDSRHAYIMKYLRHVDLENEAGAYPHHLSGGMQRRVSLARAFAYPSDTLLMDEPFKGLDWDLKEKIMETFKALWKNDQKTVIFVTHDAKEAHYLGDRIIKMRGLPLEVVDGSEI